MREQLFPQEMSSVKTANDFWKKFQEALKRADRIRITLQKSLDLD